VWKNAEGRGEEGRAVSGLDVEEYDIVAVRVPPHDLDGGGPVSGDIDCLSDVVLCKRTTERER